MIKRILGLVLAAVMMLGMLSVLSACREENPREDVISYINKLNEEKELKFIIEHNVEHSNDIQTAVQKYDNNSQLVYMYNKIANRDTGEMTAERLYQNGKDFNLINKTYYEVVLTQNSSLGGMIPDIVLLELESTAYEKIKRNEYLVTIYPQSLWGDMFGDTVFEYKITIKKSFISEIHFAGNITSISRDVGEQVIINESEFSKSWFA